MISAKILCDSISKIGIRFTTLQIEVPRIVWAEFLTHREESRNAASSRAIPFDKMQNQLDGIPFLFNGNASGMQGTKGRHDALIVVDGILHTPESAWHYAKMDAVKWSRAFANAKYSKQIFNRITEAYQTIKAVVSATEWDNFMWLRNDGGEQADPTIAELARCMYVAMENSTPTLLYEGEYHLPYLDTEFEDLFEDGSIIGRVQKYFIYEGDEKFYIDLEDAIKLSCARCAAVSYRNEGYSLAKSKEMYERLVGSDKMHASALEHVGTPMMDAGSFSSHLFVNDGEWPIGYSHIDRNGDMWSGNLRGWVQFRKTVPGECYTK